MLHHGLTSIESRMMLGTCDEFHIYYTRHKMIDMVYANET